MRILAAVGRGFGRVLIVIAQTISAIGSPGGAAKPFIDEGAAATFKKPDEYRP